MISVIIPTYNGAKYIARTIESVLSQNMEVEVLICDDWSTDNTLEIAMEYPVKILRNYHHSGGPNDGRNYGMKKAQSKYIAFLDQDDYWLPHKLRLQVTMIEKYNQDLAFSMYCCDHADDEQEIDAPIYQDHLNWHHFERWIYISSILVKNKNIPRFHDPLLDYEWLLELTKSRRCVRTIPMVIRDIHGANLSFTHDFVMKSYRMHMKYSASPDRVNASMAKYYFKIGNMKKARHYLLKSDLNLKNICYFFSTFIRPLSRFIVKRFNVFG